MCVPFRSFKWHFLRNRWKAGIWGNDEEINFIAVKMNYLLVSYLFPCLKFTTFFSRAECPSRVILCAITRTVGSPAKLKVFCCVSFSQRRCVTAFELIRPGGKKLNHNTRNCTNFECQCEVIIMLSQLFVLYNWVWSKPYYLSDLPIQFWSLGELPKDLFTLYITWTIL